MSSKASPDPCRSTQKPDYLFQHPDVLLGGRGHGAPGCWVYAENIPLQVLGVPLAPPPQVRARWNHAETTFLLFLVVGFGCGSLLQKPNSQPPLVAGEPGYRIPGASFSIYRARFEV